MSDMKIQGEVTLDTSGTDAAFARVESGAAGMAGAVARAGKSAGDGVASIGNGADAGAKKIEKATTSIIGSIQRKTAVMEAGERGSVRYYEALAAQRGVSADALKPYLSQLDAVMAKQAVATGSLNSMGMSAKQLSANLRNVPAQFTDIVVSLQSGQAPLTVLMQQGGQLKDMFGGVGNAAKALGGYVLGLINPYTLVAAAVGGVAYAYSAGASEAKEYEKTLILTGNAANTTTGQLQNLAASVSLKTGATQGSIAELLNEITSSGKVSAKTLSAVTTAAIELERAGGQAASATAKEFASLGESPAAALVKLNEKYHFLTASVYQQVKALQDQGKSTQAVKVAQEEFAAMMASRTPQLVNNLGMLEKAWLRVKDGAKGAIDSMFDIGRDDTWEQKLIAVNKAIAVKQAQGGSTTSTWFNTEELEKSKRVLDSIIESQNRVNAAATAESKIREAGSEWATLEDKYLSKRVQAENEIARIRNTGVAGSANQVSVAELAAKSARDAYGVKTAGSITSEYAGGLSVTLDAYNKLIAAKKGSGASNRELKALAKDRAQIESDLTRRQREELHGLGAEARALMMTRIDMANSINDVALKTKADTIKSQSATGQLSDRQAIVATQALDEEKINDDILTSRKKLNGASLEEASKLNAQIEILGAQRIASQQKLSLELATLDAKELNDGIQRNADAAKKRGDTETAFALEFAAKNSLAISKAYAEGNQERVDAINATFADGFKQATFDKVKQQYDALFSDMQRQIEATRQAAALDGGVLAGFASDEKVKSIRAELIPQIQILIDKMREAEGISLVNEKTVSESTRAIQKVSNEISPTWKKLTDDIERGLTDSLYRSFESGKGFGESFLDGLKNLFKTTILKVGIQGVVRSGLGAVGISAAGGANAADGNSAGSWLNTGSSAYNAYTGGSGLYTDFALSGAGSAIGLSTGLSTSLGVASGAGSTMGASAALAAAEATSAGATGLTALGSTIGAAMPYVAAAIALYTVVSSLMGSDTGNKTEGDYFGKLNADGSMTKQDGLTGGNGDWYTRHDADAQMAALSPAIGKSIFETVKALGGTSTGIGVNIGYNTDPKGKAPDNIGAAVTDAAGNYVYNHTYDVERGGAQAALQVEMQRITIAAIRAADGIKPIFRELTDGIDIATATAETLNQVMSDVSYIKTIESAFSKLNLDSDSLSMSLIKAAGGAQALAGSISSYYDNYFSEAEKAQKYAEETAKAFADANIAMPATKEAFRALVEGLDLTTTAGQATFSALMGLAPAFAQVATAAQATAAAVYSSAVSAAKSDETDAMSAVSAAMSALSSAVEAERNGIKAAYDASMSAINKQLEAANGNISKLSALSSSLKSTLSSLSIDGGEAASRRSAQDQISAALAIARAGGALPLNGELTQALQDVAQPSQAMFGSFEEYARDFYKTANDIGDLEKLTGKSLTAEEKIKEELEKQSAAESAQFAAQNSYYDQVLSSAQAQIDALNNINKTLLSVNGANSELAKAIAEAAAAKKKAEVLAGDMGASVVAAGTLAKAGGYTTDASNIVTQKFSGTYDKTLVDEAWSSNPETFAAVYQSAALNGQTLAQLDSIFGQSTGTAAAFADKYGLKKFASGTNSVPKDMLAMVHEDERIIPAADNRALMSALRRNDNVIDISPLLDEIKSLRQEVAKVTQNTKQTADTLDSVTAGGGAMLVEVAA